MRLSSPPPARVGEGGIGAPPPPAVAATRKPAAGHAAASLGASAEGGAMMGAAAVFKSMAWRRRAGTKAHASAFSPAWSRLTSGRASPPRAASGAADAAGEWSGTTTTTGAPPPPLDPTYTAAATGAQAAAARAVASWAARLDEAPRLSRRVNGVCLALAALAAAAAFRATAAALSMPGAPAPGITILSAPAAAWLAAFLAAAAAGLSARAAALERALAARAAVAADLADPDSRWARVGGGGGGGKGGGGLVVHYKAARPPPPTTTTTTTTTTPPAALALYHGFGAGAFSWAFVHRPLAAACAALVTKHDMPGFGLTDRPGAGWAGWAGVTRGRGGDGSGDGLEPYSLAFNGRLGAAVMDLELAGAGGDGRVAGAAPPPPPPTPLAGAQAARTARLAAGGPLRILVGHSLGAVCAAAEAVRDPGRVDGLVLVAPAIVAGGGHAGASRTPAAKVSAAAHSLPPSKGDVPSEAAAALAIWAAAAGAAALAAARLAAGLAARAALLVATPLVVALLRAAVRSRSFWERGLAASWGADGVPPPWLRDAYRSPQLVAGWERGLVRFLAARIPLGPGPLAAGAAALRAAAGDADGADGGGTTSPLAGSAAARLAATVQAAGVPVLLIHGGRDMLVPSANTLRLADQLRGGGGGDGEPPAASVRVALLPRRGHTPHEEAPAEFVGELAAWLEGVRAGMAA